LSPAAVTLWRVGINVLFEVATSQSSSTPSILRMHCEKLFCGDETGNLVADMHHKCSKVFLERRLADIFFNFVKKNAFCDRSR
jgi:hypothetical protein